jgi:hypothetical protein
MQGAREKIRAARKAIWLDEPADIDRLKARRKGPRNQGASPLLYADMKLGELVVFLNHLRGFAREGKVDLETMKVITEGVLESFAKQYGNWFELTDTAEVVRQAKGALPEMKTLEEYAELVEELALYVGRVEHWIDLLIPWARFGEVFERVKE